MLNCDKWKTGEGRLEGAPLQPDLILFVRHAWATDGSVSRPWNVVKGTGSSILEGSSDGGIESDFTSLNLGLTKAVIYM